MVRGPIATKMVCFRGDMGRLDFIPVHWNKFRVVGKTGRGRIIKRCHVQRFRRTGSSCMEYHGLRTVQAIYYVIVEITGPRKCTMSQKIKVCFAGGGVNKSLRPKCGRQEGKKIKRPKCRRQEGKKIASRC